MKTKEIAEFLNGRIAGDGEIDISRPASLETATENEIGFFEKNRKSPAASD